MDPSIAVTKLCIYILTWSVGNHNPDNISLNDALSLNGTSNCPDNKLPDIYVLGFQSVQNDPITKLRNLFRDDKWTQKVANELSPYDYEKVKTAQMEGVLVNVWTKQEHDIYIRDVEIKKTESGYWGSQAAVSMSLTLYNTAIDFVVAHLPGRDELLEDRVMAYKKIVKNHHYKSEKYQSISDHAVVFWLGNLNFRLNDSSMNILDEIKRNNLNSVFALDQLTTVRKSGAAFELMNEEQPTFPPTCKFVKGTSDYAAEQRPAWCDRILYKVIEDKYPGEELKLKQLSYKSHPQYTLSDHKPVTAEFLYTITLKSDVMHPVKLEKKHTFLTY